MLPNTNESNHMRLPAGLEVAWKELQCRWTNVALFQVLPVFFQQRWEFQLDETTLLTNDLPGFGISDATWNSCGVREGQPLNPESGQSTIRLAGSVTIKNRRRRKK